MTRFVLAACCALLSISGRAQVVQPPLQPPRAAKPSAACPAQPADCQINVQVFDFGRGQMSPGAPPINGHNTISVTCTRANQNNLRVDVQYDLQAIPPEPARQMRDSNLGYLRYSMYVDAARTRYWGDGTSSGTFTFQGTLSLDDKNRVGTLVHQIYGKVDGGQLALPGQWFGLVAPRLEYRANCR